MIDITQLTKRALTPKKIRLAMTSKSINKITPLIKELWRENNNLQRVIKENLMALHMMMDTVLDEDNEDQLDNMSHQDADFIHDIVKDIYNTK
tara:strand:+ start:322 stop:600 length:279 start_codon:yes stop_codon:yes gene_type:complete